ncbi:MAG: hypothetical protein PHZ02_01225 [Desulfocapsaceae bacterium]|nr:hypothetical protein [Desulfocapsaceae bacterium]
MKKIKISKKDMETTEIHGRLKKDNPAIVSEWVRNTLNMIREISILSLVLQETTAKEVYELTRLD